MGRGIVAPSSTDPADPSSTEDFGPSAIADAEWMRAVAMTVATMEVQSLVTPLNGLELTPSSCGGT